MLQGTERVVAFTILDYPEQSSYSTRVYAETVPGKHKVNLQLKDAFTLKPGDHVSALVSLEAPKETRDFDFLAYYRAKGIFLNARQTGDAQWQPCETIPIRLLPAAVRQSMNGKLSTLFTGDEQGFLSGMLTGDRSGLTQSFQFALSAAGMSHIISVSGMHVSFLVGMVLFLFGKRKWAGLIAVPMMIFFVLMTGAAPSAIRACVMQSMVLVAGLIGREDDALTSLAAALLILLVINPYSIADIGLQLSFLATLGLILFSPAMNGWFLKWFPKKIRFGPIPKFIAGTLSASFAATVLTTVPVAYYFGRVSLIAPLSNLATLWMVSAVFLGGILCAAFAYLWFPAAKIMAIPITIGLKYIKGVANASIKIPFSTLSVDNPYIILWLLLLALLLLIWMFSKREKVLTLITFGLAVLTLSGALLFTEVEGAAPQLTLTVLDIGQGQAIAASSGAYTALIDCGGNRWPGAGSIASEYFLDRARSKVDLLILTHTHSDHMNGLADLMTHVRILNAAVPATKAAEETARMLEDHGVRVIRVDTNYDITMGYCNITLYRPIVRGEDEGICILLTSGHFDALVTGDLAETPERIFTEREELPDIEVFIAGHHGSRMSSTQTLLDEVRPEVSVISVGENRYGHSSPETVARLEENGIRIYRTDRQGQIDIKVNRGG